jgi:hypothetical protein
LVPPGFRHVGSLKYIAGDVSLIDTGRIHDKLSFYRNLKDRLSGRVDTLIEAFAAISDRRFDQVPDDGLVDHSPQHYAIKIWNEYVRSVV